MNEYILDIAGLPHTVLLDDAEAKRLGASPVKPAKPVETKQSVPANKSRAPQNKAGGK